MQVEQHCYQSANGQLFLDIFRPSANSLETAILLIHGGGWRTGEPADMHRYAAHLSALGFCAIAVQYRLLDAAPWPAQLDDVLAALQWTRAQAGSLGVQPDRIALEGFSAGAHLALMAGSRDDKLAAIVAFFPPTNFAVAPSSHQETPAAMLLGPTTDDDAVAAISPLRQVIKDFPPTFFLHGSADWMIAPEASRAMHEALLNAGRSSELHIFAGACHEFAAESGMIGPVQDEVAAYLLRTVVDPRGHAERARQENIFAAGPEAFAALMASQQPQQSP